VEEFLILHSGSRKYQRVIVISEHELQTHLEVNHADALAFSSHGITFLLHVGDPPTRIVVRLPWLVWFAWWGVRFPRIRLAFQIFCWVFVAILTALGWARVFIPPIVMVLAGGLNILAWWWFELDRGRIEPGVLGHSDAGEARDRASGFGRQTKGV
jgi:hypothetical protein